MSIYKYLKAFMVFSFTLIAINAFCFNRGSLEGQRYLDSIFKTPSHFSLVAEDLQLVDAKRYIRSSFDQLTLQIYLSDISGNQRTFLPGNHQSRINFFYLSADSVALANFLQALAISNVYNGNLQLAEKDFEEALPQFKPIEDAGNRAIIAQNLSWINFITGNAKAAVEFSEIAIEYMEESENQGALFDYLFWKNDLLLASGKARQVEAHILNEVLARASHSCKLKEWECYYQLGKSYLQQQKMVQAKWFFVQALTLSKGFNSKAPQIKSLLMLAKVKSKVKDYELAIQNLKAAESLSDGANKLFKIDVALQMAAIYKELNNQRKENYYSSVYIKMRENYVN
jgi:tetratricopeptide (TPR) repeat protein